MQRALAAAAAAAVAIEVREQERDAQSAFPLHNERRNKFMQKGAQWSLSEF